METRLGDFAKREAVQHSAPQRYETLALGIRNGLRATLSLPCHFSWLGDPGQMT